MLGFPASINVHNSTNLMTGFSKAIRLVDVGLLLYEQRYSVHEEETVGYFHFGKKKTKIDTK